MATRPLGRGRTLRGPAGLAGAGEAAPRGLGSRGSAPGAGLARINEDEIVELAEMFRLMSDPSRLRIILACLTSPVAVGDMARELGLAPSLVSHHLRLLRAARLLTAERQGRQVFYVVGDPHIRSMLSDMVDHVAEGEEAEGEAAGDGGGAG